MSEVIAIYRSMSDGYFVCVFDDGEEVHVAAVGDERDIVWQSITGRAVAARNSDNRLIGPRKRS